MIINLACMAMGTRFELVLAGDDEGVLHAAGEQAVYEIEDLDRRLSLFRSDSLVSHINRTAHGGPVRLDADTFELLRTAVDVWRLSGGAFDVTLGSLMKRWGLRDGEPAGEPVWGMGGVVLDGSARTVAFDRAGLSLDLGAIAKGHALDIGAGVLRAAGVSQAFLHAGTSSVCAIGAPDDQPRGWRVALGDAAAGAPVVQLKDRSLSVSGQHGRTAVVGGEQVGHVLDPRTGAPAPTRSGAVACVVGDVGRVVEAWSTALLVLAERPEGMPRSLVSALGDGLGGWAIHGDDAERVIVSARG